MSVSPATVLVVDDDAGLRRGLVRLLQAAGYMAEPFASAEACLARPPREGPGCAVVDLEMPGMGGLELQERLGRDPEAVPVIVLTGHGDVPASVRAMKAGAVDFLEKPVDERSLLEAVARAVARDAAARTRRAERLGRETRLARLTPRERQVCGLVARGHLNKQIAARLGTSEKTIKVHRARVMAKLEVGSVADLVRLVEGLSPA